MTKNIFERFAFVYQELDFISKRHQIVYDGRFESTQGCHRNVFLAFRHSSQPLPP